MLKWFLEMLSFYKVIYFQQEFCHDWKTQKINSLCVQKSRIKTKTIKRNIVLKGVLL